MLKRISPETCKRLTRKPFDEKTYNEALAIVNGVRSGGEAALRNYAVTFGELQDGASLVLDPPALEAAFRALEPAERDLLVRVAGRVSAFAAAQRKALNSASLDCPGGINYHTIQALEVAGCYAPGGRYPLPSSVLMTCCTARAAGVEKVIAASPRPSPYTLAAAFAAKADKFLCVGGAQAIAALAYGIGIEPCRIIVGPGNRWVTAAKQIVSRDVKIDMLAGPSELLVVADASASPQLVAADLLAQAEHDPDAVPMLVSLDENLIAAVNSELGRQLAGLPTADIARQALTNGFAVLASHPTEVISLCERIAPEHLELMVTDCLPYKNKLQSYGALFVGAASAEVLGDYGAGPNHVLPTGGIPRLRGGLAVFDFLRVSTAIDIRDQQAAANLYDDAIQLARIEGLEAHARAAELRRR